MSFAVIRFSCNSKDAADTFKSNLKKDYFVVEWKPCVYSIEFDNAREVVEFKERFKKNINVKIEWAATEDKILDIINEMCKNTPEFAKKEW